MGLSSIFQDIADAIRTKTGKSESIYPVEMASEIEGISSGGGYKLEKMPSGAVSSFNDGTDLPLNKLKVSIEPVLSGWDEAVVTRTGKNLFDIHIDKDTALTTIDLDKPITTYITISAVNNNVLVSDAIWRVGVKLKSGRMYYVGDPTYEYEFPRTLYGTEENPIVQIQYRGQTITSGSYDVQIEFGKTTTEYEPYNGHTYTIQFKDGDNPLTVYGGTLDVTSGELTVTDAYIARYNAETLPSTWISDRDVYAEGTAPTIGAEVVYKLDNSVTYHLTPVQIRTLVGNNNIWTDTGDIINGEYFKGVESSGTQNTKVIEGTTTQQGFFNVETEVE